MTRDELQAVAALIRVMSHGHATVSFGVDEEATRVISGIDGARSNTSLYESGGRRYAIDAAYVEVDGVEFGAQASARPLTDDEHRRLNEQGREHERMVTA